MKINVELERSDLDAIYNIILEVTKKKVSDEEVVEYWESLPHEIKSAAVTWGCGDDEFKERMTVFLKENY